MQFTEVPSDEISVGNCLAYLEPVHYAKTPAETGVMLVSFVTVSGHLMGVPVTSFGIGH